MPEKNKIKSFNKEKIYLVVAAIVFGFLIIAGENALMFSQDSLFGRAVIDKGNKITAKSLSAEAGLKEMIFTDIPATHPNATALKYMKENGIMKGYEDGSFKPDKLISRAELMKIIIVALGEPKNINENKNCFTDVKEEWFAPYGCYAKLKGWAKGYGDGGFHPSSDVSRAEALKMMLLAYATPLETSPMEGSAFADISAEEWYAKYIWTAEKDGMTADWKDNIVSNLNNKATRLEVATAIYQLETAGTQTPTI